MSSSHSVIPSPSPPYPALANDFTHHHLLPKLSEFE